MSVFIILRCCFDNVVRFITKVILPVLRPVGIIEDCVILKVCKTQPEVDGLGENRLYGCVILRHQEGFRIVLNIIRVKPVNTIAYAGVCIPVAKRLTGIPL